MKSKKTDVICLECGAENHYETKKDIVKFKGKGYSFEMEVDIPFCKKCGNPVYVEEIEEEVARKAHQKILEQKVNKLKENIMLEE